MCSNVGSVYRLYLTCSGACMFNVAGIIFQQNMAVMKFIYTSAPGHTVDCSEFI